MKKHLEQIMRDYLNGTLDQQIKKRMAEIDYPERELDEQNIKPRNNRPGNPTEQVVIKRIMDIELEHLKRRKKCLDRFIEQADEEDKQLLIYRYKDNYTWIKISRLMHYSERTCGRKRDDLLGTLTNYLAWEL